MSEFKNNAPNGLDVSVVIPVFNGEKYLAEAIQSILEQTRPADQIVVVDDGSIDRTPDVVRTFGRKVDYVYQSNTGIGGARNRGMRETRGNLIGFLDHDDLWLPRRLELQLDAMEKDPGLDMIFGHAEQFVSPELGEEYRNRIKLPPNPLPGYLASGMLVRKESFYRAGPFDEGLRVGECIEWYGRAVDKGLRSAMLPEVVFRRRIHQTNTMITRKEQSNSYVRILKDVLDRRRRNQTTG